MTGNRFFPIAILSFVRVPASVMPCAGCHGRDGRGKPEGGVTPPNITWDNLTKPYGMTREDGRKRITYTGALLKQAILMGVDPGGVKLQAAMPRYSFTQSDFADLLAYLRV